MNALIEHFPFHAAFTEKQVRVYQAFHPGIGDAAVRQGTLDVPGFRMTRMTWIKPSFLWMMFRSNWGASPDQERILAIDIRRDAFDGLLNDGVLTSFNPKVYGSYEDWKLKSGESCALIQFDPDKDMDSNPIERRAVQIGIRGKLVEEYVKHWILKIEDATPLAREIKRHIDDGERAAAMRMLPVEANYRPCRPQV